MKLWFSFIFLLLFGLTKTSGNTRSTHLDIVLAMDLSASTNGLLINFRERYWEIINEAERFTSPIHLRIGFVSYSRPSYGSENQYVKVISNLTDDFDALAREVFAIKTITETGKQYVGAAISTAVGEMDWSKEPNALKMIIAIGNGTAYLGGSEYLKACERAKRNNIIVNTVFCKTYLNKTEMDSWRDVANLTGGVYNEIDLNKKLPKIPEGPNPKILENLNSKLNATFIPYGPHGVPRYSFLLEADLLMKETGESSFCERVNAKATSQFLEKNYSWDLVDLYLKGKINWKKTDIANLPENLRGMNPDQRNKYLEEKWNERRQVVSDIRHVFKSWKRGKGDWLVKMNITEENTLGRIIIFAVNKISLQRGMVKKA